MSTNNADTYFRYKGAIWSNRDLRSICKEQKSEENDMYYCISDESFYNYDGKKFVKIVKEKGSMLRKKVNNIIFQIEHLKAYIILNKEKEVNNIISELELLKTFL